MTVKDIISRVVLMYHDESYARVNQTQYLQMLDDALMQLVLTRPDAHTKRVIVPLKPGTAQTLPEESFSLIDIYANMYKISPIEYGAGKPIFQVDRKDLDYFNAWHTSTTALYEIKEFAYDMRTPKNYWVNPPVDQDATIHIELEYSYGFKQYSEVDAEFEDVMAMPIDVDDVFRTPIINYMLHLLYGTDSTSQFDTQLSQKYEKSFYQSLGVEYSASVDVIPRILAQTLAGVGVPLNNAQTGQPQVQ